jgi:Glycosyltransferase family 87
VNAVAPPRAAHRANVPVTVVASVVLTALVLVFLLPNLWYGLHDISDIPVYQAYSQRMANGERPFTKTFEVEYPPLAVPLFRLPGHAHDPAAYSHWFTITMGIITMLTAAVMALVACRYWPRGGRAYVAAVLFPVAVALTGAIIVNRYDAAVALLIAAFILCLSARWLTAAAFVLGMGFALKLTPAAMLPLVLILMGHPRRWAWPIVAFVAAAAAPFLPYLFSSPSGLWYVFQYHLERPLQIESVLGTPMLFGKLVGLSQASWGYSHGSHMLVARGAGLAATASGGLTLLAVAGVYLLIWRRRARLRAAPPDQAIAVLALILALMTFGKVLSPQYFIWTLPAWALVAARDRVIGVLGGLTLVLTQVEFPALYWRMLDMQPDSVAVLVARNVMLVATFGFAAWRLGRLAEGEASNPVSTSAPPSRTAASAAGRAP